MACLEVYEDSTQIRLFAYDGKAMNRSALQTRGISVAIYKLPDGLPCGIARMECSSVALSGKRSDRKIHHLLEDGEGIFAIGLGIRSEQSVMVNCGPTETEWTTAVVMVRPFHNAAKAALSRLGADGKSDMQVDETETPILEYKDWAKGTLSWLPARTEPPTRHAICGYRFATAVYVSKDIGVPTDRDRSGSTVRLTIYDFTPAHVARELSVGGEGSYPISSNLTGRAIALLDEDVLKEADPELVSTVITTSSLHMGGHPEGEIPEYATESPYLMATRNIQLARAEGSFVLHLTRDHLVFVQVRICASRLAAY